MSLASLTRRFTVALAFRLGLYEERTSQYSDMICKFLFGIKSAHILTILDVGAGTGEIDEQVAKALRTHIVGLDKNTSALRVREEYFSPIVADAHFLPFRHHSFDVIFLISLLEHLPKPELCVYEISKILKRQGFCIVQIPNLQWFIEPHTKWFMLNFMPSTLIRFIKKSTGYPELNLTVTAKNVCLWFDKAGFNCILRKKVYHKLTSLCRPWPPSWFLVFKKSNGRYNTVVQ